MSKRRAELAHEALKEIKPLVEERIRLLEEKHIPACERWVADWEEPLPLTMGSPSTWEEFVKSAIDLMYEQEDRQEVRVTSHLHPLGHRMDVLADLRNTRDTLRAIALAMPDIPLKEAPSQVYKLRQLIEYSCGYNDTENLPYEEYFD